jgi:hypothetical protein
MKQYNSVHSLFQNMLQDSCYCLMSLLTAPHFVVSLLSAKKVFMNTEIHVHETEYSHVM